jgi:transketolase
MMSKYQMYEKQANTIRFLAADMIQKAGSGHPGAPMGLADIAVVLGNYINQSSANPKWINRDRVVFSGGHATGLIYSLLHLWGYDMGIEDLQNFRQLHSKTPGHPEYLETEGVEITTGPLGQGVANAVGFAMSAKYAANLVNSETTKLIDHKVYCLCGDGDLQEGISYEACSLAGHHKLDNLVLIYDSNNITIEGDTSIAWSEDVKQRFEAQGWVVYKIDGHDYKEIEMVLDQTKEEQSSPVLIIADTVIAKGACSLEGSHHSHGAPLGDEEIACAKEKAGFDPALKFHVPEDVYAAFKSTQENGILKEKEWNKLLISAPLLEQNEALKALQNPNPDNIVWPDFSDKPEMATRDSNGHILNAIARGIPSFIGGSADLAPSNKTELKDMGDFPNGKNIHYGIRELAMTAIGNGIANYGLFMPFSATFFVFSDYMKPAARVSALMRAKHFFVWTHDSIGVGEDGPTHQPIEQLNQYRAMPNFYTFRPADATENVACWQTALELDAPSGFVLSRQKLKTLKPSVDFGSPKQGAYLIKKRDNAQLTLLASGSELMPSLQAACHLESIGIKANVVSMPCFELFGEQDKEYQDHVIDPNTKVLGIEAARGYELYKYADKIVAMDSFGASAPANLLFKEFGITMDDIVKSACSLAGRPYQKSALEDCEH